MKDKGDLVADLEAVKDHLFDLRWLIDENDLHSGAALMLRIKASEMRSLLDELIHQLMTGQTKAYKERAKHPLPAELRDAYISDLKARFGNQ